MRVLWLCNLVIPEFSDQFHIKQSVFGGWLSSMYQTLLENEQDVRIIPVFPIYDEARLKDKEDEPGAYFSFYNDSYNQYEIKEERIERFRSIINTVNPEVIHIWGTEYHWSLEMIRACQKENCLSRVVVHLQGIMALCTRHCLDGIDTDNCYPSMLEEKKAFELCSHNEAEIISTVPRVLGRTEFDKACALDINPSVEYYHCGEILRKSFYGATGAWRKNKATKKTIFISQAGYALKGFHFLIQALPRVLRIYPETEVVVAGADILINGADTPYGRYINDMVDALGVRDNVCFVGMMDEQSMIENYKRADVFVSPSTIENSSNSICEAMMIGTPVVASAVGGNISIIRHGVNGYLYPCEDYELLAFYILKCFDGSNEIDVISKNASESMSKYASKENAVNKLMDIYRTIND